MSAAGVEGAARSLLHRLNHTPLRDVLRGRLSGRLDYAERIASAGLPEPLANLVRRVVRATRLWRLEQSEVAEELLCHFQDGLATGAAPESLVGAFGDVQRAARLIRRAKKRNRPLLWRAPLRTMQVTLGLVVIVYAALTIRLITGSVRLAHNYTNEFNARALATPDHERAWPIYRQAALATGQCPPALYGLEIRPGGERWRELTAFGEANAEALRWYRLAASMPALGAVLSDVDDFELEDHLAPGGPRDRTHARSSPSANPLVIELRLPAMGAIRLGTVLLTVDAHRAALEGDAGRALADVRAILAAADHVAQLRVLVGDLTGVGIASRASQLVRSLLWEHPELFDDAQLAQLSHSLVALRGGGPLRLDFAGERAGFADLVQRFYTDDGNGDGHLAADVSHFYGALLGAADAAPLAHLLLGLGMPVTSAVLADRRAMMTKYDELMSLAEAWDRLPLWQREDEQADLEAERLASSTFQRLRYLPVALLLPSLSRASTMAELGTQERDAALLAIALQIHRRRTGAWPGTLAELTPQLMPAVPLDRYDGAALKYRLFDGQPVVYSIGVDRDDDGGRAASGKRGRDSVRSWRSAKDVKAALANPALAPDLDGDWILWPPATDSD